MCRHVVLILVIAACFASSARADKETSLEHYERGKDHYRAGRFAEAAVELERAYEQHPAPEYLYDLGQVHRRMNDCRALEYYRRYLESAPATPHRTLVLEHILALTEVCTESEVRPTVEPAKAAQDDAAPPRASASGPVVRAESAPEAASARAFELRVEAGLAFYDAGAVVTPTVATTRLSAGASLPAGPVELGAALSIALAPMRFEADENGTALLASALANVSLAWRAGARWRLRAEIGGGSLLLSGLTAGNPFTAGGQARTGLAMFDFRAAASLDYQLDERYLLQLSPAVYTRSSGHDELADDIASIASFRVLAGIGARL